MDRGFYLKLAAAGARVPIGADLVLREKPDPEGILNDPEALGAVLVEAARRYRSPLAFHLMDLMVEKATMLGMLGVAPGEVDAWHFDACPTDEQRELLRKRLAEPLSGRMRANVDALAHVARQEGLVPIGMAIGPFSLTTKLLADPITPVYMAGAGASAADDPDVAMLERILEMSRWVVRRSVEAQVAAGARAVVIAEPAANKAFFSPLQLTGGDDVFERYAIAPNREIRGLLGGLGADLIFHCCGELVDEMARRFGQLDPAILSLGSSRRLWEDAALVPKDVVLYGNLPSKRFYSDALSLEEVKRLAEELSARMKAAGHPFILGSECDVLCVPGCEHAIRAKVQAMLQGPA